MTDFKLLKKFEDTSTFMYSNRHSWATITINSKKLKVTWLVVERTIHGTENIIDSGEYYASWSDGLEDFVKAKKKQIKRKLD